MGHNILHRTYSENVDRRKVQDELDNYAAHEDWQEGCSGVSPIRWLENLPVCECREDAEKLIQQHDRGWYDCLAVRFYDYQHVDTDTTYKDMAKRIADLKEKKGAYAAEHDPRKFKAAFVGCQCCGSKISRAHLKSYTCPVCRADLRSETTTDTLKRYDQRIAAAQENLAAYAKKLERKHSPTVRWLVKVEYHT